MTTVPFILGWILCGVIAAAMVTTITIRSTNAITVADATLTFVVFLFGPASLVGGVTALLVIKLSECFNSDFWIKVLYRKR